MNERLTRPMRNDQLTMKHLLVTRACPKRALDDHFPRVFIQIRQRLVSLRPLDHVLIMRLALGSSTNDQLLIDVDHRIRRRRLALRLNGTARNAISIQRNGISSENLRSLILRNAMIRLLHEAHVPRALRHCTLRILNTLNLQIRRIGINDGNDGTTSVITLNREIGSRYASRALRRDGMDM